MRAGILDIAKVIDVAETNFHMPNGQYADVGDRVSSQHLIIGDFLVKIPKFEVYTMKWYVHNWDDTKVLTVLTNIRKSIIWGPKSGLVVLESLLSDGRMGRLMSNTDMTMMVSANGQEKYNLEWRALAKKLDGKSTRSIIYATLGFVQSKRYHPFYRSAPAPGFESTNIRWVDHAVNVTDARPNKYEFHFDTHAFQCRDDPEDLSLELLAAIRQHDKDLVSKLQYPRVERLIKATTGAARAINFDHIV
ncbi:hypothetical protein MMC08_000340 [Hypocenomyce scalaris]|nr:hypothetical protein [Hypocenomyce scalaris]